MSPVGQEPERAEMTRENEAGGPHVVVVRVRMCSEVKVDVADAQVSIADPRLGAGGHVVQNLGPWMTPRRGER